MTKLMHLSFSILPPVMISFGRNLRGKKKKKRDRGEHVRAFSKKVAGVTRVKARKLGCFLDPYI